MFDGERQQNPDASAAKAKKTPIIGVYQRPKDIMVPSSTPV